MRMSIIIIILIIMMMMIREAAEARVHSMCFGYLDSGGDDEVILSSHLRHPRHPYHYDEATICRHHCLRRHHHAGKRVIENGNSLFENIQYFDSLTKNKVMRDYGLGDFAKEQGRLQ